MLKEIKQFIDSRIWPLTLAAIVLAVIEIFAFAPVSTEEKVKLSLFAIVVWAITLGFFFPFLWLTSKLYSGKHRQFVFYFFAVPIVIMGCIYVVTYPILLPSIVAANEPAINMLPAVPGLYLALKHTYGAQINKE